MTEQTVVRVMPCGYLSSRDIYMRVDYRMTDAEISLLARQEHGGMARVHSIARPKFGPHQPEPVYSKEYVRMMSQGG